MKKVTCGIMMILMLALAAAFYLTMGSHQMDTNAAFRLKEPMLISSSGGEPYYMVPANTVLRFQRGFAEGHQLYSIDVFVKGELSADRIGKDASIESTWLYRIDADDVAKIMSEYPLTKDDLVRILKARKMNRDELAQIVRDWRDE